MKKLTYLLSIAGLVLFTVLIGRHGVAEVGAALAVSGWGLVWVALFHLVPLLFFTAAWRILLHPVGQPAFKTMLFVRWIGESVKGLLPVAQVGGDFVKARLMVHAGLPGALAGASVVVDLTLSVVTQIIFTLIGVGLLWGLGAEHLVIPILSSLAVMGGLVAAFWLLQRRGLFGGAVGILTRLSGKRDWPAIVGGAAELDVAVKTMYQDRAALLSSSLWRLTAWILGAGEVWLALYFLDANPTLGAALLLESLGQAVRSAAFMIPGAVGVQEGSYLLLGGVVGLSPEVALALSLTKRVRVFLLGLPGLVAWQITEGRRLRQQRRHHRELQLFS